MRRKKGVVWKTLLPSVVFVLSSVVLLVNNLTGFFEAYDVSVNIDVVSWIAITMSVLWWAYLFGKKNKMW